MLFLFLSACSSTAHQVRLGDQVFKVELAQTDSQRAQGLMYRESMPQNTGMLFIFDDQQPRSFWMKNTLIPLDIIYFDRNKKLVSIQHNVPPCKNTISRCPGYPSTGPAAYVLEINGGLAEKFGFKRGDVLDIRIKKSDK
ncbi:DUF192 domain-containing protein [Marinicella sp. W31]|uniref:DUF192 domain-containing protein n=1 Tax=Marinicella sp. W31 TaxID=3023713 RepID=UPI00375718BE